jgi:hypothetical protein
MSISCIAPFLYEIREHASMSHLAVGTPLPIQKQLRKEANFGCALCGCPVLEYVHILPYSETGGFLPENMIAVCPNHRIKFDRQELSKPQLLDAKKNPHNRTHPNDAYGIDSNELAVNVGKSRFINTSRILAVDDFDIVTINRENNLYIVLDVNFFDAQNELIAILSENNWTADKSPGWNIDYRYHKLVIENHARKISFEAKIEFKEIFLRGEMYYDDHTIKLKEEQVLFDDKEVGLEFKGTTLKNYDVAISIQTNSDNI